MTFAHAKKGSNNLNDFLILDYSFFGLTSIKESNGFPTNETDNF